MGVVAVVGGYAGTYLPRSIDLGVWGVHTHMPY